MSYSTIYLFIELASFAAKTSVKTTIPFNEKLEDTSSPEFATAKQDVESALRNATALSKDSLGYDLALVVTGFTADQNSTESGKNRRDASGNVAHAIVEYTGTTDVEDIDNVAEKLLEATNTAAESSPLLDSAEYLVRPEIVSPNTCKLYTRSCGDHRPVRFIPLL